MRTKRHHEAGTFIERLVAGDADRLLVEVPPWVTRALSRRMGKGKLILVSAVCPDYERCEGRFTYRSMGSGLPFTARQHLGIAARIMEILAQESMALEYHITLADTEFDLPLVVEKLAEGEVERFLEKCESSCRRLKEEARAMGLPLISCGRFTAQFPNWFPHYQEALTIINEEGRTNPTRECDLNANAAKRKPLYQAMAAQPITLEYCRHMVMRQLAQYMAWGRCAEETFGSEMIMMNHTTPNLSCVNHPRFRQGKERIPILQLSITTMPE